MTDLLAMIERPFTEIASLAHELKAVRDAGFTEAALAYPRSRAGLVAICAFNGVRPEQAPAGWRYWPNEGTKRAWERVIDALATTHTPSGEKAS